MDGKIDQRTYVKVIFKPEHPCSSIRSEIRVCWSDLVVVCFCREGASSPSFSSSWLLSWTGGGNKDILPMQYHVYLVSI